MSRKRKAPVRKIYPDPKYGSVIISKFINSIMYDGKRSTAEKILYSASGLSSTSNNLNFIYYSVNRLNGKELWTYEDTSYFGVVTFFREFSCRIFLCLQSKT